ncbi:disease resistance protein RUN1-like [Cornus florida]|uniref:disease resistance protein RUN1-like n=1 Tax=Cornus florida TaxID=4283 RepID=UPI0028A283EA|nr:disease resistance protein RUN1-like [Cornus florida]
MMLGLLPYGKLQKQLLLDLLNEKIRCGDHGIVVIKCQVWRRRVLLVLDDVDNDSQLSALAINRNWLRPRSRIVVTTRDLSAIKSLQVVEVYKLENLNREESLQIFSCYAFKRDCPLESYESLSDTIVCYTKGLPLLLTALGSSLLGKAVPKWQTQLEKLKKIPDPKVQDILRQSFNSLDDIQKDIDIDILFDRCLVSIDRRHNQLMMYDLIQDMAKEIVRQESPTKPGEHSRLWYHEDILDILRYDMVLCKLKYLNLSHSYLLIKTLDFTDLTKVHHTIGRLEDLIVLNLKNCKNLKKIPLSIFMLKSLAEFNTSGCSKLEWPAFFRRSPPASSFSSLQLPSSIRNKFSNLPTTITSLPRLGCLFIHKCTRLESLPSLPVNL